MVVPPDADVSSLSAIHLSTPDGTFYTAPVAVGSQVFAMDVDTGSTTTGVAAMGCTSCGVTPLYTPSTTATDKHDTASTQYADGSGWSGEIWQDKMSLQASTADVDTNVVGITTQTSFFYGNDYQGILGMGPSQLLETGTTSWLDGAIAAGQTPVVSFEMCDATGGTMWIGGYDQNAPAAAPQYTPMVPISGQNPFYAVEIDDLGLGGTSLGFNASTFQNPIVDTGTSLWYIPLNVENALLQKVNSDPSYASLLQAPLSESGSGCVRAQSGVTAAMVDAALPPLTLTFPAVGGGTFDVTIPPTRSYLYDTHDGNFCLAVYDDGGYGGVMGDTIMRGMVTIFDIGNQRMGLATDAGCSASQKPEALAAVPAPAEHGHRPHR